MNTTAIIKDNIVIDICLYDVLTSTADKELPEFDFMVKIFEGQIIPQIGQIWNGETFE